MTYLFRSTTIASVLGYVMVTAVVVMAFIDIIPTWLEMTLFLLSLGIEFLAIILAVKKYSGILDLANTDLDRFLAENKKLAARAKKQTKMAVMGNEIVVLLNYEKTDEVEKRLPEFARNVAPDDIVSKFQYLSYLMDLDIIKKDFSRMDQYINEKKMYLSSINNMSSLAVTSKVKYSLSLSCDLSVLEAEFYSRTAGMLRGTDNRLAMDYLSAVELARGTVKDMQVMKKCMTAVFDYEEGVVYAVLGDQTRADACMQRVAATNYAYPFIARARKYLTDRDAQALMSRT